jgi:hypothetical protein
MSKPSDPTLIASRPHRARAARTPLGHRTVIDLRAGYQASASLVRIAEEYLCDPTLPAHERLSWRRIRRANNRILAHLCAELSRRGESISLGTEATTP